MTASTRPESLQDQIATIIQAGHRDRKTSDEIAGEVVALALPASDRLIRLCAEQAAALKWAGEIIGKREVPTAAVY